MDDFEAAQDPAGFGAVGFVGGVGGLGAGEDRGEDGDAVFTFADPAVEVADEAEALGMGIERAEYERLTTLSNWASSFLCRSHEDLGRAGPVCPYARTAIEQGLFLLGEIDLSFDHIDEIAEEIAQRETEPAVGVGPEGSADGGDEIAGIAAENSANLEKPSAPRDEFEAVKLMKLAV